MASTLFDKVSSAYQRQYPQQTGEPELFKAISERYQKQMPQAYAAKKPYVEQRSIRDELANVFAPGELQTNPQMVGAALPMDYGTMYPSPAIASGARGSLPQEPLAELASVPAGAQAPEQGQAPAIAQQPEVAGRTPSSEGGDIWGDLLVGLAPSLLDFVSTGGAYQDVASQAGLKGLGMLKEQRDKESKMAYEQKLKGEERAYQKEMKGEDRAFQKELKSGDYAQQEKMFKMKSDLEKELEKIKGDIKSKEGLNAYQQMQIMLRKMGLEQSKQQHKESMAAVQGRFEKTKEVDYQNKVDRQVTDISKQMAEKATPKVINSLADIAGQIKGVKNLPGFGAEKFAPDFLVSDAGKKLQVSVAQLGNALVKASAGATQTAQEIMRTAGKELQTEGIFKSDRDLRIGLQKALEAVRTEIRARKGGYLPEAWEKWSKQSGLGDVEKQLESLNMEFIGSGSGSGSALDKIDAELQRRKRGQ